MHQDLSHDTAAAETAHTGRTLATAATATGAASAVANSTRAIPPTTVLYVGNLYFEVSEDALQQQFTPYGKISRVRIAYDHRGLSKGYVSSPTEMH